MNRMDKDAVDREVDDIIKNHKATIPASEIATRVAAEASVEEVRGASNASIKKLTAAMQRAIEGDEYPGVESGDFVKRAILLRNSVNGLITAAERRGMIAEAKRLRKKLVVLEREVEETRQRLAVAKQDVVDVWYRMAAESPPFSLKLAPELRRSMA